MARGWRAWDDAQGLKRVACLVLQRLQFRQVCCLSSAAGMAIPELLLIGARSINLAIQAIAFTFPNVRSTSLPLHFARSFFLVGASSTNLAIMTSRALNSGAEAAPTNNLGDFFGRLCANVAAIYAFSFGMRFMLTWIAFKGTWAFGQGSWILGQHQWLSSPW